MSKRQAIHLVLHGKYERTVFCDFGTTDTVRQARANPAYKMYRVSSVSGQAKWYVFSNGRVPHWRTHVPDLPKELEMLHLMGAL